MPIAPRPTADIGCDAVKSPRPDRCRPPYCDHAPCDQHLLHRAASGEPGRTRARSSPITATIALRTDSAFVGSPRACSSMTRSSMLDTKVTPLALIACKSHGASNQGAPPLRRLEAELARVSPAAAAAVGRRPSRRADRRARRTRSRSRPSTDVGAVRANRDTPALRLQAARSADQHRPL